MWLQVVSSFMSSESREKTRLSRGKADPTDLYENGLKEQFKRGGLEQRFGGMLTDGPDVSPDLSPDLSLDLLPSLLPSPVEDPPEEVEDSLESTRTPTGSITRRLSREGWMGGQDPFLGIAKQETHHSLLTAHYSQLAAHSLSLTAHLS